MLTAQDRESKTSRELVCSPDGALVVTNGPGMTFTTTGGGSIEDQDFYLLGILLTGGATEAQALLEVGPDTLMLVNTDAGKTTFIGLPAPIHIQDEEGLAITLQGTGPTCTVFYMPG